MAELTDDTRAAVLRAAQLLTGHKRRRYQAEVTHTYCNGSARRAETTFGWGRDAVRPGLGELRTGIRCLDAYHLRGRHKAEDDCPELADHIRRVVDPHAQADPKLQTPLAYTRLTARAVRDALLRVDALAGKVPGRQAVGDILNRLGYRLRSVLKTRPEKKSPRRTPSSPASTRPAGGRRANRTRCGSPSTARRP